MGLEARREEHRPAQPQSLHVECDFHELEAGCKETSHLIVSEILVSHGPADLAQLYS